MYIYLTKFLLIISIAAIFALVFHNTYATEDASKTAINAERGHLINVCSIDGENLQGDLKNPYNCA